MEKGDSMSTAAYFAIVGKNGTKKEFNIDPQEITVSGASQEVRFRGNRTIMKNMFSMSSVKEICDTIFSLLDLSDEAEEWGINPKGLTPVELLKCLAENEDSECIWKAVYDNVEPFVNDVVNTFSSVNDISKVILSTDRYEEGEFVEELFYEDESLFSEDFDPYSVNAVIIETVYTLDFLKKKTKHEKEVTFL